MRVVRGSLSEVDRDRQVTRQLADLVTASGSPVLRVWTPPRQVSFGRRDATEEGYERARAVARDHGYAPVERSVGGRAVAHTGSTVGFAYVVSNEGRDGIQSRYAAVTRRLEEALRSIGAEVRRGEPDASFCPGTHSLQNDGKIAGLAQRVRDEVALVGGYVVATDEDATAVAEVLDPVYGALGVPFDPVTVGSVEGAGGPGDVGPVVEAIQDGFGRDRDCEVLSARELVE